MSRSVKIVVAVLVTGTSLASVTAAVGVVILHRSLRAQPDTERCLGFALPAGSRVLAETGAISPFGGERFFVIEMSQEGFDQMTAAGGFTRQADALEHWPGCLDAPPGFPWLTTPANDRFTIYRDAHGALDVARWEGGRLYYRHHVS
jgi:hypothetical protein